MSDQLWTAIISSLAALLGSIAGYVAASIQTSRTIDGQMRLEAQKRTWHVEDEKRQQAIAVKRRRCDQAEEFIGIVTEDFQHIRHAALFILQSTDQEAIRTRIDEYARWRDSVPKRVYAFGAVVGGLGNPDLVKSWDDQLYPAFERMTEAYKTICSLKETATLAPARAKELFTEVDSSYEAYNKGLGAFMLQLDRIMSAI